LRALVTTLSSRLKAADALFEQSRFGGSVAAFSDLLSRAQEKGDHPMEIVARSMCARCLIRRHDIDGAREHLQAAGALVDPLHVQAHGRYRAALARLAVAEGFADNELRHYLEWATDMNVPLGVIDACTLLARSTEGEIRAEWLERAIDEAETCDVTDGIGELCNDLGATLDLLDRRDEAAAVYVRAVGFHRAHGTPRQLAGACWAAGAALVASDDWGGGRELLDEAVRMATTAVDAQDILALALADLARVQEASGDVIEARRLLIRAAQIAREQGLPETWPGRWRSMVGFGRTLELTL
jgi:tetratricopeptide (TPR) repeat protein